MQVTFTFPDDWSPRILNAFGRHLRVRESGGKYRAATVDELKRYLWGRVREVVVQAEREAAVHAATVPTLGDPT